MAIGCDLLKPVGCAGDMDAPVDGSVGEGLSVGAWGDTADPTFGGLSPRTAVSGAVCPATEDLFGAPGGDDFAFSRDADGVDDSPFKAMGVHRSFDFFIPPDDFIIERRGNHATRGLFEADAVDGGFVLAKPSVDFGVDGGRAGAFALAGFALGGLVADAGIVLGTAHWVAEDFKCDVNFGHALVGIEGGVDVWVIGTREFVISLADLLGVCAVGYAQGFVQSGQGRLYYGAVGLAS